MFVKMADSLYSIMLGSALFRKYYKIKGAGVAQSVQWLRYVQDERGSFSGRGGKGNISFRHRIWSTPSLLSSGIRISFPGAWSWPLSTSAEVKNGWNYNSTQPCVFMA